MTNEELIEEVKRYYSDNFEYLSGDQPTLSILTNIARHFAKWGAEHAKKDDAPVPADLEEAADEMAIRAFPEKKSYSTVIDRVVDYNAVDRKNYREGIIAGAKWQKQHDAELIEIAYNDGITIGMTKQKEQMLNEAVKWLVDDDYDELTDKGKFILGSVGIGYNGYYIPYSDLLKLPNED